MSKTQLKPEAQSITDYLHLFVLVAFAIAQPVYDILGQNPEFFVAQGANPTTMIIAMVLVLSIGLGLILIVLELIAKLISRGFQHGVHRAFVFSLAVLIVLPLMKKLVYSDLLIIAISLLLSLMFVVLYVQKQVIRTFVTLLLPVVFVFPALFLLATPAGNLIKPQVLNMSQAKIKIENKVPIVVVVFDELTTTALLDSQERIDKVRFPNFATLAAQSSWFPNAVSTYFTTVEAVPAILSGLQPRPEMHLVPTASNYPQNLFTLLSEHYELNVFEPLTEMCPEDVCRRESNIDTRRRYTAFFADIIAIYLHMIAPPMVEKKLPHFGAQWAGFGAFLLSDLNTEVEENNPLARYKGWERRDLQIESFLSRIKKKSGPELHFMHVLLPHVPLEFLSTGHKYNPSSNYPFPDGMTQNITKNWIWTGEEQLILTSYHQYLQQVGYADKFLGRLKNKLELEGLYDKALIIVTADHGVSFQHGSAQRRIENNNHRGLLQTPMFVKLPSQQEGYINKRFVSGVDVLPTIIDVLKLKVPWVMDGRSMFSIDKFSRSEIVIPGVGNYKLNDIKGFPRLKWQVKHFGTNTSLDLLSAAGPYPELVGKKIDSVQIGGTADLQLRSEDFEYFKQVDLDSGFLPALFKANIEGTVAKNLPLAIALNGSIRATTKTTDWDGKSNYLSILLPPKAFINGDNQIVVYLIENKENTLLLKPLEHEGKFNVRLQRIQAGQEILILPDGRKVQIETRRKNMDGYLDWLTLKEGMFVFDGWAADLVEKQPVSSILIFKGEELVWQVAPAYKREGVVKAFKQPTLLRSGYRAIVPLKVLEIHPGNISVIAISKDKRAFRLYIKDKHKELIRTTLVK